MGFGRRRNRRRAAVSKGFDEFAGYFDPATRKIITPILSGVTRQRAIFNPTNHQREDYRGKTALRQRRRREGRIHSRFVHKAALNFIRNNQPDRFNHYRPFFLLLNYTIPGADKAAVPTDAPFSSEAWPQPEKNRAAMIARLDGYIGQLLEQLQNSG